MVAVLLYTTGFLVLDKQVQAYIDQRILLYSKDQTGMQNFAHPFQGADIIHQLTSPTYHSENPPDGTVPWQPELVIGSTLQAGRCWSFVGPAGYLGIALSEAVVVSNVTLEHVSLDLAPQSEIAPKEIVVWGFSEDIAALDQYRLTIASQSIASAPFPSLSLPDYMSPGDFVPVSSFTYDVHSEQFLQIFAALP